MNIAEFSIKKDVITWVFAIILVIAGIMAYNSLPRLEDPEFTIKEAIIITLYPGASAEEVEEEVSNTTGQPITFPQLADLGQQCLPRPL